MSNGKRAFLGLRNMPDWHLMFALPNMQVHSSVEVDGVALVSAHDDRIKQLMAQYPNYATYLASFRNEFGAAVSPSSILVRDDAPVSYHRVDALASFRDVVAFSSIPYTWMREFEFGGGQDGPKYANTFVFYPWMLDKNYQHLAVRSLATFGFQDDVSKLQAQTSPAVSFCYMIPRMFDAPILEALLKRWQRRYSDDSPAWKDRAVFRSLNMANAAATMPTHADITEYDLGRMAALWVSAFEILAHPPYGKLNGFKQVYSFLERIRWNNSHCNKPIYSAYPHKRSASRKILPCWIYGQLNGARNGNRISKDQLISPRSQRALLFYAPILYRMALASFLDIRWKERKPSRGKTLDLSKYEERKFNFESYQRAAERALESVKYTKEEWIALRSGKLSPTVPKRP
jgi:hypothetical protein